ncbi:mannonate dehydratase [Jiella marina]|uniref:mannonate dehydratase n=1 Tax=Jiella sp. LLJ827 TaxID=2917712 RepID=UPI002101C885|nr:mannonate dehydratase [Jiella sp. LLJ827]MCQ0986800.1 mannonate dehydratase [Jiella sp. LLJ827]
MRQTWRWFGPNDLVSIDDMLQAGVEGVVSALHHVATGAVWAPEAIAERQRQIATRADGSPSGIAWEVVESLPVSEDVKKQRGAWREHIANYKTSLKHLGDAGIQTICYNFMPVLDWTRTDLAYRVAHGGTAMRFDVIDFAAFDIFILARPGSRESFPEEIVAAAEERFAEMSAERRKALAGNVVFGLPGAAETFSLEDVRAHLSEYAAIDENQLRSHFVAFLEEVAPVAEDLGMRLCCHPDDPPFPLLGLPRIMSTEAQYRSVIDAVDLRANGITLCSGSLGVRSDNDLPGMMQRLGDRVHFLHLRNTIREDQSLPVSFYEAEHLAGDTDMVALVAAALAEEKRRRDAGRADAEIPFRPDHGQDILDDLGRKAQPGYPAIGRLKGLAELRGVVAALSHPASRASA